MNAADLALGMMMEMLAVIGPLAGTFTIGFAAGILFVAWWRGAAWDDTTDKIAEAFPGRYWILGYGGHPGKRPHWGLEIFRADESLDEPIATGHGETADEAIAAAVNNLVEEARS